MHVSHLWRYPVKSMAGEPLETAMLGPDGVHGDRILYVVDARGEIVSARTRPALLGHGAALDADGRVTVDDHPWDSPEAAELVERAAGRGAHLVRAAGSERFDILPLLVVTDGALAAFGRDPRRLRPNVVVAGVPGLTERDWEHSLLEAGEAVIALSDLRGRCIVTTFDPDDQSQDVGVLRDLNHRFDGTFALNAWVGRSGTVRVGDRVQAIAATEAIERPLTGRFVA